MPVVSDYIVVKGFGLSKQYEMKFFQISNIVFFLNPTPPTLTQKLHTRYSNLSLNNAGTNMQKQNFVH